MSFQLDMAAANAWLKEWYDAQRIQKMVYGDHPTLAMTPKNEEVGGKYYPVPVVFEGSQGRSSTFTNAHGNQTPAQGAEFMVTLKKDYGLATFDNMTIKAMASERGAFMVGLRPHVDLALGGVSKSISSSLFRSGTGSIAQISGAVASGVITLSNPADLYQFSTGQTLQANATDGGTPRAAKGYVINRSIRNGTITVSDTAIGGAAGTPSGWQNADFLLVDGDNNAKPTGFKGWLPMTDPTSSDNFYGVNRSVDYRLFGINYDGSGQSVEEALIDHLFLMGRENAAPDVFVTNFGSNAAIVKALGTRRIYEQMSGPAGISFRAVVVDGVKGPVRIMPDADCQVATGYHLTLNTWKLISLGPAPQTLMYEEREQMLRVYNGDQSEFRSGAYLNLCCDAPVKNGQLLLSS